MIKQIENKEEKLEISRNILESLKDWFEIEDAREKYIQDSTNQVFFADIEDVVRGFLCLKETSKDTLELAVMGVIKEYHRKGIGQSLFNEAKKYAKDKDFSFIQVKTVAMGYYKEYDETNKFYQALGFKELETLPNLWDEENPCLIYVMFIKSE